MEDRVHHTPKPGAVAVRLVAMAVRLVIAIMAVVVIGIVVVGMRVRRRLIGGIGHLNMLLGNQQFSSIPDLCQWGGMVGQGVDHMRQMVQRLGKAGTDVDIIDTGGAPVSVAAELDDPQIVQALPVMRGRGGRHPCDLCQRPAALLTVRQDIHDSCLRRGDQLLEHLRNQQSACANITERYDTTRPVAFPPRRCIEHGCNAVPWDVLPSLAQDVQPHRRVFSEPDEVLELPMHG